MIVCSCTVTCDAALKESIRRLHRENPSLDATKLAHKAWLACGKGKECAKRCGGCKPGILLYVLAEIDKEKGAS